jgi:stage V sporulation protein D (sporulation-specific penicillin-binding protein)
VADAPIRRRTAFFLALVAAVGVALCGRTLYLMLVDGPQLAVLAAGERTHTVALPAPRGEILDAEGRVLAGNVTYMTVTADPPLLPAADDDRLAAALHIPVATLKRRLGDGSPDYAVLASGLSVPQAAPLQALNLPGVNLVPTSGRYYPEGSLLGPALGFTGAGGIGRYGLEYSENALLAGRPGSEIEQFDAAGNPLSSLSKSVRPPVPGDTLRLTVDLTLSQFAQEVLDGGIRLTHASAGRILVTDPQTGAILAMAQWPSGNPNDPNPQQDPAAWTDSIVQSAYPPGSTFKPVTAGAALQSGVITPATRFYDGGSTVITGVRVYGWEYPQSFGWLNFDQAVMHSSDIAFMEIGLRLGVRRFYHYLRAFGLLQAPDVPLPGASAGVTLPESQVRPLDLAEMAFGQTNAITALQLAEAVGAVANGGRLMAPQLVSAIVGPDGRTRVLPPHEIRRVVSAKVSAEVVKAMEGVITPSGTGAEAAVPGYRLAGKTGTAQLVVNGKVATTYMSSFIGFGPIPDPRVLILVQLNRPQGAYYGGQIAAPLFSQLMRETLRYLGVPPSRAAGPVGVRAVPAVSGDLPSTAEAAVRAAGLVPLTLGSGPVVVSSLPGAGDSVVRGGTVDLILGTPGAQSGGRQVPDLVGMTLRRAYLTALAERLPVWTDGEGVVVRQWPESGSPLPAGAKVRLWLALPRTSGPATPALPRVGRGPKG